MKKRIIATELVFLILMALLLGIGESSLVIRPAKQQLRDRLTEADKTIDQFRKNEKILKMSTTPRGIRQGIS